MTPSYFERSTGHLVAPLLVLRVLALAILAMLGLALLFFKSGGAHAFCLGLATGLCVGLVAQLFSLRSVEVKDTTRPSGVDQLPLTR
jgi:cyanate permease